MEPVSWDNLNPTVVPYTIADASEINGRYPADNIRFDKPTEAHSRWSATKETTRQWLVLELTNVAVLDSIMFGKYHQPHPCNMREFKVEFGMTKEHMTEVLFATLKNDTRRETFTLRRTTKTGVPIPTRFIKIIPISTHAHHFNTSIWYVELMGFSEAHFVKNAIRGFERNREILAMQHVLKHLRERRHLTTYYLLSAQTGVQLEHPLVSELYERLVIRGDWARAEQCLNDISSAGLFAAFINTYQPAARWKRLRGLDANGDAPSKRGGHAMCMDVDSQLIYLFGGFDGRKSLNDFWVYDIRSDRWRLISHDVSKENGPGPRACHKMTFDPKSGYIYLLGRLADEDVTSEAGPEQSDELRQQPASAIEETPANADGTSQSSSSDRRVNGASAGLRASSQKDVSSEFYRYKTRGIDEGEWKLLNMDTGMKGGPKLVYDHQLELDPGAQIIYVYGGRVIENTPTCKYSGMYSYDIRSGKWTSIPIGQNSDSMALRFGHSMVFDSVRRSLVIFAGQQDSNRYLNDMWEYDLQRQSLVEITPDFTSAGGPEPCFAQRAVIDPELQEIYIFDGLSRRKNAQMPVAESAIWLYRYAEYPGTWTRILPPSPSPPPHKKTAKARSEGITATKRTRSEMDEEDEDTSNADDSPVPRWAHQVVYDRKSQTFYMHGGNAGISLASNASSSRRRGESAALEDRLDDFWAMTLERPPVSEVVRRAKFHIRQQRFREMCEEMTPVKSLSYLQTDLSSVVDHDNEEEEEAFRSLLTHLLQPSLPVVDLENSKFDPSSSHNGVISPESTPSDQDLGWTNVLPTDEDSTMADASVSNSANINFRGTMVGETMSHTDDPHELHIRGGQSLTSSRFKQRTEVFRSLLTFISSEAKQPDGSLPEMLHHIAV